MFRLWKWEMSGVFYPDLLLALQVCWSCGSLLWLAQQSKVSLNEEEQTVEPKPVVYYGGITEISWRYYGDIMDILLVNDIPNTARFGSSMSIASVSGVSGSWEWNTDIHRPHMTSIQFPSILDTPWMAERKLHQVTRAAETTMFRTCGDRFLFAKKVLSSTLTCSQ